MSLLHAIAEYPQFAILADDNGRFVVQERNDDMDPYWEDPDPDVVKTEWLVSTRPLPVQDCLAKRGFQIRKAKLGLS